MVFEAIATFTLHKDSSDWEQQADQLAGPRWCKKPDYASLIDAGTVQGAFTIITTTSLCYIKKDEI